jgi:pSer/pThr/pTyr-binding forkhead associated (FHA) protein
MSFTGNGSLVPVGGGDAIPLIRETLSLGRRESCDICLRFPNVSGMHCQLSFQDGYWLIRDMGSTNGIKVNGKRVLKKVLHPGDTITIAKRNFTIEYTQSIGKQALDETMEETEDLMDQPLLQKAGLEKPENNPKKPKSRRRPWEELDEEDDEEA